MIGALRPGELKRLDRARLLLLGARCALRVKPWLLARSLPAWGKAMSFLLLAIDQAPPAVDASAEMKSLLETLAFSQCSIDDKVTIKCNSYAVSTLASAIEVAPLELSPGLIKGIVSTAKLSASVFTSRAHAKVSTGDQTISFVDEVIEAVWNTIRTDIELVSKAPLRPSTLHSERQSSLLTQVGPLWPEGEPSWSMPEDSR